ncbi:MAG: hypothetical protein ACKVOJ_11590 [Sphingomonadaceae bacterium]
MAKLLKAVNKIPFAPVVAIAFGLMSAILVFAMPLWRFQQFVMLSGLPNVLSFARPPLGDTARGLAALALGLGVASLLWLGLSALSALAKNRTRGAKARGRRIEPATVPPSGETGIPQRRPIFAERDLGAPFMSDEVIAKQNSPLPSASAAPVPVPPLPRGEAVDMHTKPQPPLFAPTSPFAAAPPPIDIVAQPPAADAILAPPSPPAARTEPLTSEPSVADLMARLDAALDRRMQRGTNQPAGDIASLRQALGGLTGSAR